jgi:hypothetical protein
MDPLLYIEKGKPYHKRRKLGRAFFLWSMLFLSLTITSLVLELPVMYVVAFEIFFLIFLCLYFANAIMKSIFLHFYKERLYKKRGLSFEAALAKEKGRRHSDDVHGFISSRYGYEVMKRLGLTLHSLEHYLERRIQERKNERWRLPHEEIMENKRWIDLQDYASYLHDHDQDFAEYLRSERVARQDLAYAALLIHNISALQKELDRFWSNKKLHDLSPFELSVINKERQYGTYVTAPAIRILGTLEDNEREEMLERILNHAKREKLPQVHISDIRNILERE